MKVFDVCAQRCDIRFGQFVVQTHQGHRPRTKGHIRVKLMTDNKEKKENEHHNRPIGYNRHQGTLRKPANVTPPVKSTDLPTSPFSVLIYVPLTCPS
ncbi:hypothetical protein G7K_2743-t1 [Saitoella complicata NRRL Y-17804]|uniref:Uncharacterized protein n=1 Tax=Saitoella complicata (strain BCRC 22490 / CBS 7301 / JCM 7358 / NBRC 10748 / NRRL Y-17804) TaxID=698492 RepID=A0A0E9NGN6_SAICN|nr:hypothetical protein G7K_2743-t1 [Saitoella complicata NRRL Y-17804]